MGRSAICEGQALGALWTREQVIESIQAHVKTQGMPTSDGWVRCVGQAGEVGSHPSKHTVARLFGSWTDGLVAAGVGYKPVIHWKREEIIQAIRYAACSSVPRATDWLQASGTPENGGHPSADVVRAMFGSWDEALHAAGVTDHYTCVPWTREQVLACIRQHAQDHRGWPPSSIDWQRSQGWSGEPNAHPGAWIVGQYFGSWAKGLEAAGLAPRWSAKLNALEKGQAGQAPQMYWAGSVELFGGRRKKVWLPSMKEAPAQQEDEETQTISKPMTLEPACKGLKPLNLPLCAEIIALNTSGRPDLAERALREQLLLTLRIDEFGDSRELRVVGAYLAHAEVEGKPYGPLVGYIGPDAASLIAPHLERGIGLNARVMTPLQPIFGGRAEIKIVAGERCKSIKPAEAEDVLPPLPGGIVRPKRKRPKHNPASNPPLLWTREEITAVLQAWDVERSGRANSVTWAYAQGKPGEVGAHPSGGQVRYAFGSWDAARLEAGLPTGRRVWTREEIIAVLQAETRISGDALRCRTWEKAKGHLGEPGAHPVSSVVAKLFGSWRAALCAAGLEPSNRVQPGFWTKERIIATLQHEAKANGMSPLRKDWKHCSGVAGEIGSHPTSAAVDRHFGSWDAALCAAGLEPSNPPNFWTRERIISALRLDTEMNGRVPTSTCWKRASGVIGEPDAHPALNTVTRRFSSWAEALKEAGLRK